MFRGRRRARSPTANVDRRRSAWLGAIERIASLDLSQKGGSNIAPTFAAPPPLDRSLYMGGEKIGLDELGVSNVHEKGPSR
jgi:hypothetical protein